MVHMLEAVKGGGGSIRVGATGTIGALMTRELESKKCTPETQRRNPPTVPVSISCGASTKRLKRRTSSNGASTSASMSETNHRNARSIQRKAAHHIPMLGSEDLPLDRTPNTDKPDKKGSHTVEIVDLTCGNSNRAWPSPITNSLKKLSFSRLSETIN